jgi:bifunctional non-homologous end joining protein LigD
LLPELGCLAKLGELVLDGELVAAGPDGRADFELLGTRMMGPARDVAVCLYAFDALALGGTELVHRPWFEHRDVLDGLDLSDRSGGLVRRTIWTADGTAMHQATAATRAEGTVSKRRDSPYRGGRSRHWRKAKHSVTGIFEVLAWRPSTSSRHAELILGEDGEVVGAASIGLARDKRTVLVNLLDRYGKEGLGGVVSLPSASLMATVRYGSRTPTRGRLREAVVTAVQLIEGSVPAPS